MFPRTILTTTDPLYVHNLTYAYIGTSTRGPQLTASQGTSWIDAQQDATPKGKNYYLPAYHPALPIKFHTTKFETLETVTFPRY
jgi:hypothetical protein